LKNPASFFNFFKYFVYLYSFKKREAKFITLSRHLSLIGIFKIFQPLKKRNLPKIPEMNASKSAPKDLSG